MSRNAERYGFAINTYTLIILTVYRTALDVELYEVTYLYLTE